MTTSNSSWRPELEEFESPFACCDYPSWLKRLTYKPFWNFAVRCPSTWSGPFMWEHELLILVTDVPDAHGPGTLPLHFRHGVPNGYDQYRFWEYVRHCIWEAERHEMDEFLQIDGKCFREPHA